MERSAFDALFTTDRLQILKVLLPCLPPERQGGLAVYIKMQEFFYAMDIVRNHPNLMREALGPVPSGETVLEQIFPFCSPSQQEQIRQMRQMSRQMDSMREMMETVQMMQSLFPEGMNPEGMDLSQLMTMFSAAGMDSTDGSVNASAADAGGPADSAPSGQSPGSTEDDSARTPMPDERSVRSSTADMDSTAGSTSSWEPGQTEGGANPPEQTSGRPNPVRAPYAAQENRDRSPFVTPDIGREVIQEQVPVTDFPSFGPRDEGAMDSEGIPFPAWRSETQAAARDVMP